MRSVKIIIAAHKKYRMPSDSMYIPLHVGAEGKKDSEGYELDLGYVKDNTGENISYLNDSFCELTGLYWAWKNVEADFIGLVHYRRHFGFSKTKDPFDSVLTYDELSPYLEKIRVFVPRKRNYYIETLYSHYSHTHYEIHLIETKKIIKEFYPEYLDSCTNVMNERKGYMFNMMIMESKLLDNYCEWLFRILFELSNRIDSSDLSRFQGRFYGRVSEILFNVWIDYQLKTGTISKNELMEIPCIHMEKVNWIKKCSAFLKAKFLGKKYEASF